MGTLTLDLREGFQNDPVVVRVDGREVANMPTLSTDYSIGLAKRISTPVGKGPTVVEIECPAKGLTIQKEIEVHGEGWLTVRLEGDALILEQIEGEEPLY